MWKNANRRKQLLNCLYTFWSVGALIGPFIIRLFICSNDESHQNMSFNQTLISTTNSTNYTTSLEHIIRVNSTKTVSEVQFQPLCLLLAKSAFLYMGIIITITGSPFLLLYFLDLFFVQKEKVEEIDLKIISETRDLKKTSHKLIVYSFLFFFTALNISIEVICGQYIVNFASKYLHWSVKSSSLLITIYFITHALSRAFNMVILLHFKAHVLLVFNTIMCIVSFSLILIFIDRWPNILYVSMLLVGYFLASNYPVEILYVSEIVTFTQIMSAITSIGTSMGGIVSPIFLTSLNSHYGLMSLVYYQLISSFILFIIVAIQIVYFKITFKKTRNLVARY